MNNTVLAISITAGKHNLEQDGFSKETPLEERARACFMEACRDRTCWMTSTDDERFSIGCGLLTVLSEGEELDRIAVELRFLRGFSAAISGVPVSLGEIIGDGFKPIGLVRIFKECNA